MLKKAIITGATGSIGPALIECLLKNDVSVTVFLNPQSARNDEILNRFSINKIFCDISNYDNVAIDDTDFDYFFHLAWCGTTGNQRNDEQLQIANYNAVLSSIKLAKRIGCKKYIGIGSQAEYGRKNTPLTADMSCSPDNYYGKYKLKSGINGKKLANKLNLEFNWIRVASVFGNSRDESSLPSYIIRELTEGNKPQFTLSEQIWDFLYAVDAADAIFRVAEKGIDGKTYVLGSGKGLELKEYIKTAFKIIAPNEIPKFGDLEYSQNQIMYLVADISELRKDTGFVPRFTFEDAIKDVMKRRIENEKNRHCDSVL